MATSKKKRPRAGKAAPRKLGLVDIKRVYTALYNARTQVRVLGSETDDINNLIIDQMTDAIDHLLAAGMRDGIRCR